MNKTLPCFGIHENVEGFDIGTFDGLLSDHFHIWHLHVKPADLAWGVTSRRRVYSVLLNKKKLRLVGDVQEMYNLVCDYVRRRVAPVRIPDSCWHADACIQRVFRNCVHSTKKTTQSVMP